MLAKIALRENPPDGRWSSLYLPRLSLSRLSLLRQFNDKGRGPAIHARDWLRSTPQWGHRSGGACEYRTSAAMTRLSNSLLHFGQRVRTAIKSALPRTTAPAISRAIVKALPGAEIINTAPMTTPASANLYRRRRCSRIVSRMSDRVRVPAG